MFDTTSPRMFVVTTISGLSALSDPLSSLQPAKTSEIMATNVVAVNTNFFIDLRNINILQNKNDSHYCSVDVFFLTIKGIFKFNGHTKSFHSYP